MKAEIVHENTAAAANNNNTLKASMGNSIAQLIPAESRYELILHDLIIMMSGDCQVGCPIYLSKMTHGNGDR